jgi:hypothetical protein
MRRYKSHIAIFCFILFVFPVVAKQMHALIHSSENHCNEHHVVHLHESEHNCFLCDYVHFHPPFYQTTYSVITITL